jgi:hypothetical protein
MKRVLLPMALSVLVAMGGLFVYSYACGPDGEENCPGHLNGQHADR